MPTVPPAWLLDRPASKAAQRDALAIADPLLTEVVNFGAETFARCASLPGPRDYQLAILFPYRHLLELTDAIHVLACEGALSPARLQLRASFEAFLTIRYVTESDTERRGYAYLVGDTLTQISNLERLRDDRGPLGPVEWVGGALTNLHARLDQPGWRDAHQDFIAIKPQLRRKPKRRWWPPWYALYGGPTDLAGLAECCGRASDYNLLYRPWSDVSHATDITWQMHPDATLRPLRSPLQFKAAVNLAVEFMKLAADYLVAFYGIPGHDVQRWYADENIAQRLAQLESLPIPI